MRCVEIDWAPAYELVVSCQAFVTRSEHKTLELGAEWIRAVRRDLDPAFVEALNEAESQFKHVDALSLLIHWCPAERDASSFLRWLGELPLGELYERLEPHVLKAREELLSDLAGFRDRFVTLLSAWNEQYFNRVDPAILAGLEADAAAKRELAASTSPNRLLEIATNGILFEGDESDETVLLVPQYHYRPWNLYTDFRGWRLFSYPADALPATAGEPPAALLRMTRALSDPSRLRILRFLAEKPRSFTELVRLTNLSKSTVHHHMVILRAAGLVHVHETGAKPDTYTLRPRAADDLGLALHRYIATDGSHTTSSP